MPTSFIELVREKFISPLEKLSQDPATSSEWWAVVMDDQAKSIFKSCCEEHQLIKHNVTTIDRLNEERSITSQFGVLYYVFPTEENIDRIIKDFQAAVPQSVSKSKGFRKSGVSSNSPFIANSKDCYKSAYLYFLEIVPDEIIVKIKSSPIYPYLKGLTEIYINYYPFESNVFNLRETDSFFKLFSMSTKTSKKELINLAQKLVTVCSSLKERPLVRFQSMSSGLDNPCILAYAFQNELDRFCQINNIPTKDPSERATLLILDRACDFYAPILHDFTYQAMINDLIHLADGITYRHEYVASSGKTLENFYTLNEKDDLWKELRHFHIAECNQKLTSKFHNMISENPAAKSMLKRRQNGEVAKLREMRDIVTSVPELQQHQELYSLHFGLAETVMERFKSRQLEEVAMCEQNISTGTFPDGETLKNALNEMVPILNNPKVLLSDKLRLLLIYQIHMKGFANVDRRRLESHAGLTQSDKDAITNMEFLLNNRPTQPSNTDNITRFMSSLSFKGRKKEEQEEVPYDISRYQPALKKILINLIDNQLDFDAFPQVGASDSPSTNPPASPTKKPPTSLRKSNKPAWELKSDDPSKPAPSQTTGGKIIVFIAGGASYSELRAAYEVSKAKNREILIGSTDIIAPDDFVEALRLMRYQAAGNPVSPPQANLGLSPKPIAVRSTSPLRLPGDKPRRSKGGVLDPPHMHMANHLKDHQHRSSMPNLPSDLDVSGNQTDQPKSSSTREPRKPLPTPGQYNTISVQRTASEQVPQAPRPQNPYKAATASKGGFFSKLFQ